MRALRSLLRSRWSSSALGHCCSSSSPTLVIQFLNAAGRPFAMTELTARIHDLWAAFAVAYMVLATAFCYVAQKTDPVAAQPVLFLLIGEATSALVSLLYFVLGVHAFAFLANCMVSTATVVVTGGAFWLALRAGPARALPSHSAG